MQWLLSHYFLGRWRRGRADWQHVPAVPHAQGTSQRNLYLMEEIWGCTAQQRSCGLQKEDAVTLN